MSTLLTTLLISAIFSVTVFVLRQFILKRILEPTSKLKEKIGDVDSKLYSLQELFNENLLPEDNCNISEDNINTMKRLSGEIRQSTRSISVYFVIRHLFDLPPYGDLRESCDELFQLSKGLNSIKEIERNFPRKGKKWLPSLWKRSGYNRN